MTDRVEQTTMKRGYQSLITGRSVDEYPSGDIEIISSDGYIWRMDGRDMQKASIVFLDAAAMPHTTSLMPTIPLDHPSSEVHALLSFLTTHSVELPPITSQPVLGYFVRLITMLDKYACETHLLAAESQALMLVARIPTSPTKLALDGTGFLGLAIEKKWKHVVDLWILRENLSPIKDPLELFLDACKIGSTNVAGVAVGRFGEAKYVVGQPHPWHPSCWTEATVGKVGLKAYMAFVRATADYSPTEEIDWAVVSQKFSLPAENPSRGYSGYAVSPHFDHSSPVFSPTSPMIGAASPAYSPSSPMFSPTSPSYSPTSPSAHAYQLAMQNHNASG